MGEAFWAAREGDALLHTSFLADLVGSALEFAINAVIDFAALAVVALATGATVATLGCSAVLLVGTVVGATMLLSGAGEKISKACEDIANSLFPPKIEGYILTGSGDTRINSKRAARAAATALSRHDVETLDAQAQAEAEEEKRRQDAKSMWDVAGEYLDAVKGRAENMAKGVVSVVSRMGSAEGWASLGNDALTEAAICFPTRATLFQRCGSPRWQRHIRGLTRNRMIKSTATNIPLHSPSLWRRNCRR